jgi:hypothetical protein
MQQISHNGGMANAGIFPYDTWIFLNALITTQ